eukprot:TRINITY_DN21857_c0_g1_i1.p1 TRINITY_DN21857_c0_g1~~TRINITY_DN21857_c0_g1_i1.p1  ORF type:complete len:229 (+),score=71.08 TRINITY_DN21857_c0_g1_i1:50-736(+)
MGCCCRRSRPAAADEHADAAAEAAGSSSSASVSSVPTDEEQPGSVGPVPAGRGRAWRPLSPPRRRVRSVQGQPCASCGVLRRLLCESLPQLPQRRADELRAQLRIDECADGAVRAATPVSPVDGTVLRWRYEGRYARFYLRCVLPRGSCQLFFSDAGVERGPVCRLAEESTRVIVSFGQSADAAPLLPSQEQERCDALRQLKTLAAAAGVPMRAAGDEAAAAAVESLL